MVRPGGFHDESSNATEQDQCFAGNMGQYLGEPQIPGAVPDFCLT